MARPKKDILTKAEKVSEPVEKISEEPERVQVGNSAEDFIKNFVESKGGVETEPETIKQPYLKEGDYRITPMGNKVTYTGKMFEGHKVFRVWFKRIDRELLAYKDEKLGFVELDVGDDGMIYRKEKQRYINH